MKFNILRQFGHPKRRVSFFVSVVAYALLGEREKWSPIFFFKNCFLKYEANMFNALLCTLFSRDFLSASFTGDEWEMDGFISVLREREIEFADRKQ